MSKLQFKFRTDATQTQRRKVMEALGKQGPVRVRRLFPQTKDRELAAVYVVESGDGRLRERLLEVLNSSADVEFAEEEVPRKLIW